MSNKLSERRNLVKRLAGITMPIGRKRMKWQRNWLCLCGSDRKYKNCCLRDIEDLTRFDGNASVEVVPENIQEMIQERLDADGKKG